MKKTKLGRSGLEVSRVGMGGIPIQRPLLEEAVRVINHALDRGINFIDTSIGYEDSEIRIGEAIASQRDDVILATKGSWRDKATSEGHIDSSLKRLNTDHIDLWQFHNIRDPEAYGRAISPGGSIEAAREALNEGKILHLGFSTHNLDVALKGVESDLFETVQFPFNFIAREAAEELIPLARKYDVGFIGMKPFAGGNITDARFAIGYVRGQRKSTRSWASWRIPWSSRRRTGAGWTRSGTSWATASAASACIVCPALRGWRYGSSPT